MSKRVYNTIYWPKKMWRRKKELAIRLYQIEGSYSKFMQTISRALYYATWHIKKEKKKFHNYKWGIILIDKKTGEKYVC